MSFQGAKTTPLPSSSRIYKEPKVFVEKPGILEDLLNSVEEPKKRYVKTEIINRNDLSLTQTQLKKNRSVNPLEKELNLSLKPEYQSVSEIHAIAGEIQREKRNKDFPLLLNNVDKATNFLNDIDKELKLVDESKYNKTRRQYEEWNTNVHGEIQKRISKTINETDSKALNKKKNQDYSKFLNITNKKAAIFRDIIIESEYDPLEPNRRCIKATTQKLKDPVKISQLKSEAEAAMLVGSTVKNKEPLGKDTLNVELWASGKIEATPYGSFAKMMSSEQNHDNSSRSATMKSSIHFNHFEYPKGRAAIDEEMPKGKRVYPTIIYSDPGRIFGHLPPEVEREIAAIKPPENRIFPGY